MKNRTILFIILITIIVVIAVLMLFFFKPKKENKDQYQPYTYMIGKSESEDTKVAVIHTFDGDKCIDTRIQYIFTDKNNTKDCYNNWKNVEDMTNVKMLNDYTIIANTKSQNGRTKESLRNSYINVIIEEY